MKNTTIMGNPHVRQRRGSLFYKKAMLMLALGGAAVSVQAGLWFNPSGSAGTECNWTVLDSWYTWYYYTEKASKQYVQTDVNIAQAKTAIINTDITKSVSAYWSIALGSNLSSGHRATVRIENGGKICGATQTGCVSVGHKMIDGTTAGYAVIDIRPGGTFDGWTKIGTTGIGIVTNAGTLVMSPMEIGVKAGAKGTYVHDNGVCSYPYPKDIQVGIDGEGELLINAGTFAWKWYVNGEQRIGYQRYGCGESGQGKGTLVIEDGSTFNCGTTYFGGDETKWGAGLLRMRGGKFYSDSQDGKLGIDTMWIGAGQDENGAVRTGSYGEIRGWGTVSCQTYSAVEAVAITARLGNGAVVADGEGVERTLDCSQMWQVTNVLFCAESERTNGWYAVNKGALLMPGVNMVIDNGGDNWSCQSGSNAVGCCRALRKPDLINAVYIDVGVPWKAAGKNFGVMLLASDRSDAHADKLNPKYSPLGFWKVGVFDDRIPFTEAKHQDIYRATVDFRYDHHKVADSANRLAVLRWSETNQRWTLLNRYDKQPSDYIVSSGKITTTSDDPVYGIGLLCVAEQTFTPGSIFMVR